MNAKPRLEGIFLAKQVRNITTNGRMQRSQHRRDMSPAYASVMHHLNVRAKLHLVGP